MGWLMNYFMYNLGQEHSSDRITDDIVKLQDELEKQRKSSPLATTLPIKELQKENDELKLYIAALIKILVSKGVMTKEEIKEMIDIIDSQDGSQDGKFKGNINP